MPEEQVPYGDEDRDKVCPLRMIGHANGGGYLARPRCLKEECAWWVHRWLDKSKGGCAIVEMGEK